MYRVLVRPWPSMAWPDLQRYMRIDRRSMKAAYELARLFDPHEADVVVKEKIMLRNKKFYWAEVSEEIWREEV